MQTEKREEKRRTLAGEILEFLLVALAVAAFTFCFLYVTSQSLAETYLTDLGVFLSEGQQRVLWVWLRSLCLMAAAAVFLVLFLFMLGQRIAYLLKIIRGVDALQASRMDAAIPLEGDDELTELAERINYLAVSERELTGREQRLREERDSVCPPLQRAVSALTGWIAASGNAGVFLYGFLERLLIPTGLHHLIYMPFQFSSLGGSLTVGSVTYTGAYAVCMTEYTMGLPLSDGIVWMYTGFTKTFGYLGIAAAFIFTARKENRARTAAAMIQQ